MGSKKKREESTIEWEFGADWFKDLQEKVKYNVFQSEYYERMADDYNDDTYRKKAERTLACSKVWDLNYYVRHGIKQIKSITRCQDSFCYVCQSLKAQRRFQLFSPILRQLEKTHDIFHTVFTVPNVSGQRLNWTLDKMYSRFGRMNAYLKGEKKIKGIDFFQYGYVGAVRSLEITTGKRRNGNDFHPHFHTMIVLSKNPPNMEKCIENSFSNGKYDYVTNKRKVTYFSKFEWLLQRIWCLLMLDIKVTKQNIIDIYGVTNGLYKDGFDVKSDNAEGKFHEIFKYAIKGTYKKEKIFDYEDFCYLENALRNRRVYETYGVLREYNFNDTGDISSSEDLSDVIFNELLRELQRREKPIVIQSCVEDILTDLNGNKKRKKKIRYIGPAVLRRTFQNLSDEEKETCLEKMRELFFGQKTDGLGDGFVKAGTL